MHLTDGSKGLVCRAIHPKRFCIFDASDRSADRLIWVVDTISKKKILYDFCCMFEISDRPTDQPGDYNSLKKTSTITPPSRTTPSILPPPPQTTTKRTKTTRTGTTKTTKMNFSTVFSTFDRPTDRRTYRPAWLSKPSQNVYLC